ncbi:MAG TPA: phosphatase PAP2 family protein [Bdellovibrionota bacterium]|nr:phosphatase PAP2 family protein [Bdellovibrionota bacterium]
MLSRLLLPPKLTKKDIILTLLPALLWIGGIHARAHVINAKCAGPVPNCAKETVLKIDQASLGLESSAADGYSYFTQNAAGLLAVSVPAVWNASLFMLGRATPATALAYAGTDLILFAQAFAWNGFIGETVRLISQRPRPFVYADPIGRGLDPAHYISYYSGHTSFTAAAVTILLLILLGRGATGPVLLVFAGLGQSLILMTAMFRVLAGRHFVTDVVTAAVAGSLVSLVIALIHKPKPG